VIAGSIANASIGTLLVAGLIPGLFIALMLMVFNHIYAVRHGYNPPTPFNLRQVVTTGIAAILPMLTPVILMAGIVGGYFTPTEAAGIAVLYTLFLSVVFYRTISVRDLPGLFVETARTSGTILFIAATAKLAAWVFTYDGLPAQVAMLLNAISTGPTMALVLIFLFLIVVGMFMDAIAAMFILIPVLLPPAVSIGVDPIHFLIVMVVTLTLGLVTPPVGVCLFAVAQVAKMSIEDVIKGSLAPMLILVAAIFALVLFPQLTLTPIRLLGLY
jgi:tripartite ATP-independent transporter DctM subunit